LSDMDRDIRKPAMLTGGFSDRSSLQDSNSNSGSNGSSGGSTDATTISDTGSPSSPTRNPKSSGKNKTSSSSPRRSGSSSKQDQQQDACTPGVTFDEEVQDLVAVSRMMIERQEGAEAAFVDAQKKRNGPPPLPKVTRPVVSCLKKKGSDTSLQSRNGRYESGFRNGGSEGYGSSSSASSTASSPTSSSRRRRKRVTFKRSTARRWFDHLAGWIPFMSTRSGYDGLDDLESQQHQQFAGEDESFWSSLFSGRNHYYYGSSGRRYSASSLFWTILSVINVGLLFVGLVLALMNLGDGIGMEAASIFLVVSCLCMGTSVWAHLIRMDGQNRGVDDDEEEQDPHVMPYSTTCISTKNNVNERTGLLSRSNSSSSVTTQQQYQSQSRSLFKARWVRKRLLPVVTFLCLVVVVGLNALARAYPTSEEIGSD
jgi:hypothetical protein